MKHKNKNRFDDGFQAYLTENANFSGEPKMPEIMVMHNESIPKSLIPFSKIRTSNNKRGYIHFYIHDKLFENFIADVKSYIPLLTQYDGVITPDCSMANGQLDYLQMTNTYFNRAVGVYLQKQGISVIPTVRWSDESSFAYCFNGLPINSIVAISTHGCIKSNDQKAMFRNGLIRMLETLHPKDVIVYGYMPKNIFGGLEELTNFHRYPNHFETNCRKDYNNYGKLL